eukprot:TRINITY_DN1796_c0_g1_i1.p1 TRINITY_DN1796_c0_g1~~TRINITY_DN1796_c0_g1_i1.p1  ORF type:complete len:343 (-),score=152.49 TRINITY_DN1796_c0_g1_i1:60-1088(-)
MVNEMQVEYEKLFKNEKKSTKAVFLSGEGGKAFCAGGDIKSLHASAVSKDPKDAASFFAKEYHLDYLLWHLNPSLKSSNRIVSGVTTIANMNGITMGGGVGIAISSQIRIVTEKTVFAMPETGIGLFPDVGGTYFLGRDKLKGPLGIYIGLTGNKLSGADCIYAGIGTHFVSSEKIKELEEELRNANFDKESPKSIVEKYSGSPSGNSQLSSFENDIQKHFKGDKVEQFFQSLQESSSEFANNTLQTLKSKSPSSMKVTLKGIQNGSQKDLAECFEMEFRMAVHSILSEDFAEGVRAVLVDKDNKPKWNPSDISAVDSKRVDSYFGPPKGIPDIQMSKSFPK